MVTHLLSGVAQGFQDGFNPFLVSPHPSPLLSRRGAGGGGIPVLCRQRSDSPSPNKRLYIEFSNGKEKLGRIVIKVWSRVGRVGWVFESLVTHRDHFGYRGSRVYACCKNDWILLGDLLYHSLTLDSPTTPQSDWDPRQETEMTESKTKTNKNDADDIDVVVEDKADNQLLPSKLHRGYRGILETECDLETCDLLRGSVVLVASDLDLESQTWRLGPQVKICLADNPLRSCRVIGQVVEGMDVADRISHLADKMGSEPAVRVTIADSGYCC
ncbi:hypothetical protein Pmani_009807 [Petrolisthes manimaculis]|uniref:PPIase cyclophilin-type domain-containing protein n=1 Tax=Petrolisthes manimaculis TaxID=1843537 RepID=A0AAE1Q4A3_9EUCA|nr:hypothetical protein Pmani_009807 [Petrolisthes manimaculis]